MILSQNKIDEQEELPNDFESINEIKQFIWNYKATLIIFVLNLAGFILTEIYGDKIYNLYACNACLLYTSPSPRDGLLSRMPSSA